MGKVETSCVVRPSIGMPVPAGGRCMPELVLDRPRLTVVTAAVSVCRPSGALSSVFDTDHSSE